jgi:hypothetical protein
MAYGYFSKARLKNINRCCGVAYRPLFRGTLFVLCWQKEIRVINYPYS